MTTAAAAILDLPAPARASTRGPSLRTYALETKYEFFKLLRPPHYSVPVLAFPVMFYLLFGLSLAGRTKEGVGAAQYLLASYSIFGVVTAALFAFGAGVATERALGWLVLKRATPMPVSAYLAAKVASAMLFGAVILITMAFCAIVLGGVHLSIATWLKLLLVVTLGSIPFCLVGLLVAFIVPPAGAPGIMNLINLPLAFAGGLWMPVEMLPKMFAPSRRWSRSTTSGNWRSPPSAPHRPAARWVTLRPSRSRRSCSAPRRGSRGAAATPAPESCGAVVRIR